MDTGRENLSISLYRHSFSSLLVHMSSLAYTKTEGRYLATQILDPLARHFAGRQWLSSGTDTAGMDEVEALLLGPDGVLARHRKANAAGKARMLAERKVAIQEALGHGISLMVTMAEDWVVKNLVNGKKDVAPVKHLLRVVIQSSGRPVFTVVDSEDRVTRFYWRPDKAVFMQLYPTPGTDQRLKLVLTKEATRRIEGARYRPLKLRELARAAVAKQLVSGRRTWDGEVVGRLFQHNLDLAVDEAEARLKLFEAADKELTRQRRANSVKPKAKAKVNDTTPIDLVNDE
jgi:hypothetical protein